MSPRTRWILLITIAVVLVAASVGFVLRQRDQAQEAVAKATPVPTVAGTSVAAGPHITFRNAALGTSLGMVAMVPIGDPSGPRALTSLSCDRVFSAARRTLCLSSERGLVTTYAATVYEADGSTISIPLTGSPSRARLSDDGRFSATTSFVAGDSYAAVGFSTRTVITDLDSRKSVDLESFRLIHDGTAVTPVDRNFWGVTFAADDDSFYVTVAYGGKTYLAKGKVSTRSVETLRTDAECPSLSPDGTRVAYKKRGDRARGDWRIAVLDLATGVETPLPETRSVDDQVEWLDDATLLYGMPGVGSDAARTNVFRVAADGRTPPTLLIRDAWSPAVVR